MCQAQQLPNHMDRWDSGCCHVHQARFPHLPITCQIDRQGLKIRSNSPGFPSQVAFCWTCFIGGFKGGWIHQCLNQATLLGFIVDISNWWGVGAIPGGGPLVASVNKFLISQTDVLYVKSIVLNIPLSIYLRGFNGLEKRFLLQRWWGILWYLVTDRPVASSHPYCRQVIFSGWWFGTFFSFPYIGNNHPNWLIFFRGVETTNQFFNSSKFGWMVAIRFASFFFRGGGLEGRWFCHP